MLWRRRLRSRGGSVCVLAPFTVFCHCAALVGVACRTLLGVEMTSEDYSKRSH